jgi:hypothetical protein
LQIDKWRNNWNKYLIKIIKEEIPSSWEDIQRGRLDVKIGSEIVEKLKTGEEVIFVVTDMDEEYIRIETKGHIGPKVPWHHTCIVDVPKSDMFHYLHTKILESFPDELRNVIATTERKYISFRNGVKSYECKLFLPDPLELFGTFTTFKKEIPLEHVIYEQLEYYKHTPLSKGGKCWLNSGRKESFHSVCCMGGTFEESSVPWEKNYVSVCFLIKRLPE